MLSDGGYDDSRTLAPCFLCEQVAHDGSVSIIQMADGFVQEYEVKGLAKAADKSDTLLLAERQSGSLFIHFVCHSQGFEEGKDFLFLLIIGELVLQLYVFEGSKFGKDTQLLKENTERMFSDIHPFISGE